MKSRAETELPDILLSYLTASPATTGMLMGKVMTGHSWLPTRSETIAALLTLVDRKKVEQWKPGCWRVGSGVIGKDENE